MALTKSNHSLAQITATGATAAADIEAAYAAVFSLRYNHTGTATVGARAQPQITHDGTNWRNDGGAFVFDLAAGLQQRTYVPPTDGLAVKQVRFDFTAPVTATSPLFDVEYTRTTGL